MADKVASTIEVPSSISPANAEDFRLQALAMLEAAKESPDKVILDVEAGELTPVAVQLLVAATRTAERFGVAIEPSARCQTLMTELQLN